MTARTSSSPTLNGRTTRLVLLSTVLLATLPAATLAKPASLAALSSAAPSTVDALIEQYGLTQTFTFPQPDDTLSSNRTGDYLQENWSLNRNQLQAGSKDLSFVADPFDSSNTGSSVLDVRYDKGSYGGSGAGGAQFYAQPLNGSSAPLSAMLLQYDVAFDEDFNFSQGGKLPGVRGGPEAKGCTGGNEADGLTCFTARLMWRTAGAGEAYMYIPTKGYGLCKSQDVICNSDYGTSLSRGSFTLQRGQWNSIALFVQLNNPPETANGRVFIYANNTLALAHDNLQLRASDAISSVGGLFFSTFFGGADVSWASPQNQSSYFRNFKLLGGTTLSDGAGSHVGSAGWKQATLPALALGATGLAFLSLLL